MAKILNSNLISPINLSFPHKQRYCVNNNLSEDALPSLYVPRFIRSIQTTYSLKPLDASDKPRHVGLKGNLCNSAACA